MSTSADAATIVVRSPYDQSVIGEIPAHTAAGTVSIGGVSGAWAFGTATMTAGGSVVVNTGLTTVIGATSNPLRAGTVLNGGMGTYAVQIDASRFANGSILLHSVAGGTITPGGGTVAWTAFGY
jgi:hypothetical protein